MAARRLSMRKIKEVLRLHCEKGLSAREIARSLDIGRGTIKNYLARVQQAGLSWPLPPEIDEATLEHRLFSPFHPVVQEKRQMPPMEYLHQELRKKGVTLQLLWHEYKEKCPEGYQYSQFCRLYHQWGPRSSIPASTRNIGPESRADDGAHRSRDRRDPPAKIEKKSDDSGRII
jgi:transposase